MALTSLKHNFFERTAPQTFKLKVIVAALVTENVNYETDNMYRRERIWYEPTVGTQSSFLCDFNCPCTVKTVNQPPIHWPSDHWSFQSYVTKDDYDEFVNGCKAFAQQGRTGNGPCSLQTTSPYYKERQIIGSFQQAGTSQVLRCGLSFSITSNSGAGDNPTIQCTLQAGFALDTPGPNTRGMRIQMNMVPYSAPLAWIPWDEFYEKLNKFQVACTCGWATGNPNGWRRSVPWTDLMASIRGWVSGRDDQATPTVDTSALHITPPGGGVIQPGNWTTGTPVDPTDPSEEPTPPVPPDPNPPVPPSPDPPSPDPSEPIVPSPLPPIGGSGTGFFTVYNPSIQNLRQIASILWSSNMIQQLENNFKNPMETIMGLGIVPVKPPTGDAQEVKFGIWGSGVSAPVVTSEYVEVDCGSRYIGYYYYSYLDFEPYTKMSLYLPYVGEIDMNPDEVTGKTLRIKYHINVITGECVAYVMANGTVIYIGSANCFRQIPLSQADLSQVIQSAISAISTIAGAAIGGAVAASAGGIASGVAPSVANAAGMSTGGQVASASLSEAMHAAPSLNNVMANKMYYHRAGQLGTGSGQLSIRKPYITILRPNLMLPDDAGDVGTNSDLKAYKGYPCNQVMPLTNATGMTVIENCRLSIPGATVEEVNEALSIMKGGYIA